jgi:hypothetical protein
MVHFVHIWRYQEAAEKLIQFARQADIGMGKRGGHHYQRLIDHNAVHRGTRHKDQQQEKNASQQAISGVMAKSRCYIYVIIAMMNKMKSPEQWTLMHNQVDQPATEVERQNCDHDGHEHGSI